MIKKEFISQEIGTCEVCEINQFFIYKDNNWKLLGRVTN